MVPRPEDMNASLLEGRNVFDDEDDAFGGDPFMEDFDFDQSSFPASAGNNHHKKSSASQHHKSSSPKATNRKSSSKSSSSRVSRKEKEAMDGSMNLRDISDKMNDSSGRMDDSARNNNNNNNNNSRRSMGDRSTSSRRSLSCSRRSMGGSSRRVLTEESSRMDDSSRIVKKKGVSRTAKPNIKAQFPSNAPRRGGAPSRRSGADSSERRGNRTPVEHGERRVSRTSIGERSASSDTAGSAAPKPSKQTSSRSLRTSQRSSTEEKPAPDTSSTEASSTSPNQPVKQRSNRNLLRVPQTPLVKRERCGNLRDRIMKEAALKKEKEEEEKRRKERKVQRKKIDLGKQLELLEDLDASKSNNNTMDDHSRTRKAGLTDDQSCTSGVSAAHSTRNGRANARTRRTIAVGQNILRRNMYDILKNTPKVDMNAVNGKYDEEEYNGEKDIVSAGEIAVAPVASDVLERRRLRRASAEQAR